MFKIDSETKLVAISALNLAIASPLILASAAKQKTVRVAKQHPKSTAVAGGLVGGVVLAAVLVDGEKAHPASLYAKIF